MRWSETIKSLDWVLIGAVLLLCGISLAMLFSSTETALVLSSRFSRQLLALGVAGVVFVLLARTPYRFFERWSPVFYGIGIVGLLAVFMFARVVRGTASRLEFGGFQFQPSEFMKVALVVALAWIATKVSARGWRFLLVSGLVAALPVGLVVAEPDLGVAVLLLGLWALVLLFVGISWWKLFILLIAGAGVSVAAWYWLLADYQKQRLAIFLDPMSDPLGAGYNVVQSLVAFGSGRLWGRGLGHGPQSQLQFLPERHTDFIMASVGEELGFLGVSVVLILYAIILWRVLRVARSTPDLFGQLVAVGTFSLLLLSLAVVGGMNMGLLPVTGLPLPFLSYGGSHLVATFVLLGLVQSVYVHSKWMRPVPKEIDSF